MEFSSDQGIHVGGFEPVDLLVSRFEEWAWIILKFVCLTLCLLRTDTDCIKGVIPLFLCILSTFESQHRSLGIFYRLESSLPGSWKQNIIGLEGTVLCLKNYLAIFAWAAALSLHSGSVTSSLWSVASILLVTGPFSSLVKPTQQTNLLLSS